MYDLDSPKDVVEIKNTFDKEEWGHTSIDISQYFLKVKNIYIYILKLYSWVMLKKLMMITYGNILIEVCKKNSYSILVQEWADWP
jgi:hypothetical protein